MSLLVFFGFASFGVGVAGIAQSDKLKLDGDGVVGVFGLLLGSILLAVAFN